MTRLTVFTSSDTAVATVTPTGLVEFNQTGEVAILCRYLKELYPVRTDLPRAEARLQVVRNPPEQNYVGVGRTLACIDIVRRTNSCNRCNSSEGRNWFVAAPLMLGEHDAIVHEVLLGRIRSILKPGLGSEVGQSHRVQFHEVAAQDGHFAGLVKLDLAGRRDRGDGVVAAGEHGQAGDVLDLAVGEG